MKLITTTGSIVNVTDEKAERLINSGGYKPADNTTSPAPPTSTPADTIVEEPVALAADELAPPAGNASREKWLAFLEQLGVDVPEDATRDDMKAIAASLLDDEE